MTTRRRSRSSRLHALGFGVVVTLGACVVNNIRPTQVAAPAPEVAVVAAAGESAAAAGEPAAIADPVEVRGGEGEGTYVDVGWPHLGTQDFTISHWYQTSFAEPGTLGDVIGNRQSPSHGNFVSVRMNGDGKLAFEVDGDDDGDDYTAIDSGAHRINDGRWHHLAYTRRGGELSLYVDGERVARGGSPTDPAADLRGATPFRMGRSLPPCCARYVALPGTYADVQILAGRALGDDEIRLASRR